MAIEEQQLWRPDARPHALLETTAEAVRDRSADRTEIVGRKGSIYYRAHSYHTKVPPEGIARLVEHYTDPGEPVVDPFCGSGMTGVACRLTGRHGVLSDLSPAAVHIARGYASTITSSTFSALAESVLAALQDTELRLYRAVCPLCGDRARVEYTVWSDVFACPACEAETVFWEAALDHDGTIRRELACAGCGATARKTSMRWVRSVPVRHSLSCRCSAKRIEHDLSSHAVEEWAAYDRTHIADWYPTTVFDSGREMWRGQHGDQGLSTAADFFTARNLETLAKAWAAASSSHDDVAAQALRFLCTSVINRASRRYQWNPKRPTNVLSSTMYVASLSYEFNVGSLLRRKARTLADLYRSFEGRCGHVDVAQRPAQHLADVPDSSVPYVFTDPPFGSNIFYADSSFLWEAWLGTETDQRMEAVVNKSVAAKDGGKTLADYEKLMTGAFEECARVLRPGGWMSVMFHNSDDQVWSALERSIEDSGFVVEAAVAFDKSQASFKGLKGQNAGERVANFDLVLHLRRRAAARRSTVERGDTAARDAVLAALTAHIERASPNRRTTPWLHSLAMRTLLERELPIDGFSYDAIEQICMTEFEKVGEAWQLRAPESAEATV